MTDEPPGGAVVAAASERRPTVPLRTLLAERGLPIALVAAWYQLAIVFVLTPAASVTTWLAVMSVGGPAVVNTAILRLLVSPVSLSALAVGQVAAIAGSCLVNGACSVVVLEGVLDPIAAIWSTVRRLPRLVAIVLWGLWRALLYSLAPLALAGAAYLALFGLRSPADVIARSLPALIALGAAAGVVLGGLWVFLYLRWLFAIPVCVAEKTLAREALDRSWQLTRGRWLRTGFKIAGVQLLVVTVGGIPLAILSAAAIYFAGGGVGPVLITTIVLYSVGAVVLNVALSASFESVRLSSFLSAAGRELGPALPSTGGWVRWVPIVAVLLVSGVTGVLGILGVSKGLTQPTDFSHIELIAHRAGETYAPENSLAAVARARKDRASRIEFDVRRTADGQLVVVHDGNLKRVSGKNIEVAKATFAEIGLIDIGSRVSTAFAGEGIPPLGQFLDATGDTPLALEIKTSKTDRETTREVVQLLRSRGDVARTVVISLDPRLTALAHSLDPQLGTGDLIGMSEGRAYVLPADIIAPAYGLVNSQFVADAHSRGKKVWVWTIEDESQVQEAALRGVDGIITNDVPRARRALEALGGSGPDVAEVTRQRVQDLIGE